MRSTATARDHTLMMASTMAMNFANGPMVRHMFMRSKDITGSAASTTWLTTSITGRDIWLFSSAVAEFGGALLQADGQDDVDGGGTALRVGAGDPGAVRERVADGVGDALVGDLAHDRERAHGAVRVDGELDGDRGHEPGQ